MSTRLQHELARLYLPASTSTPPPHAAPAPAGPVRAAVLSLARPAAWAPLAVVWREVQQTLGLPAPAIAIAGSAGFQLWFSLPEAAPHAQAHAPFQGQAQALLIGLQQRYLADLPAGRISLWPAVPSPAASTEAALIPAASTEATLISCGPAFPPQPLQAEQWSAFVAPDLAPVFAEEPWLDTPPNPEGQADLLARLQPMRPEALELALQTLAATLPAARAATAPVTPSAQQPDAAAARAAPTLATASPERGIQPGGPDPASQSQHRSEAIAFLTQVMHNSGVDLALRIEAAKALLGPR